MVPPKPKHDTPASNAYYESLSCAHWIHGGLRWSSQNKEKTVRKFVSHYTLSCVYKPVREPLLIWKRTLSLLPRQGIEPSWALPGVVRHHQVPKGLPGLLELSILSLVIPHHKVLAARRAHARTDDGRYLRASRAGRGLRRITPGCAC